MWATSVLTPSVFVVLTFISLISNAQVNDCPWPSIPNSQWNCTDDNRYSSVCNYTCDTGYELNGNSSVQCTANKTWSNQPLCLIINCTWPTIPNSQRNCTDDNRYSSVCTYTCDTGYELDGNSSVQCTANKTWSDKPSCPKTHCSSEPDVSNSYRLCTNANEYQSVCSYTCKTGYELRGVPIVTCLATETWTPEPSCPKISCAWPTIPNSKRSCTDSNQYSSVCTYTCDTGYELQGSPTAKCNADKTWSNQPACTKRVDKDDTLKKVIAPVFSLVGAICVVIIVIGAARGGAAKAPATNARGVRFDTQFRRRTYNDKPGTVANGSNDKPGTVATGSNDKPGTVANGSNDKPGTVANESNDKPGTVATGFNDKPGTVGNGSNDKPGTVATGSNGKSDTVAPRSNRKPGTVAPGSNGKPLTVATGSPRKPDTVVLSPNPDDSRVPQTAIALSQKPEGDPKSQDNKQQRSKETTQESKKTEDRPKTCTRSEREQANWSSR